MYIFKTTFKIFVTNYEVMFFLSLIRWSRYIIILAFLLPYLCSFNLAYNIKKKFFCKSHFGRRLFTFTHSFVFLVVKTLDISDMFNKASQILIKRAYCLFLHTVWIFQIQKELTLQVRGIRVLYHRTSILVLMYLDSIFWYS